MKNKTLPQFHKTIIHSYYGKYSRQHFLVSFMKNVQKLSIYDECEINQYELL